jgi:hypothetical protein
MRTVEMYSSFAVLITSSLLSRIVEIRVILDVSLFFLFLQVRIETRDLKDLSRA